LSLLSLHQALKAGSHKWENQSDLRIKVMASKVYLTFVENKISRIQKALNSQGYNYPLAYELMGEGKIEVSIRVSSTHGRYIHFRDHESDEVFISVIKENIEFCEQFIELFAEERV
jgi:hypothetical protein